jgi:hypothetical protein
VQYIAIMGRQRPAWKMGRHPYSSSASTRAGSAAINARTASMSPREHRSWIDASGMMLPRHFSSWTIAWDNRVSLRTAPKHCNSTGRLGQQKR